MLDLGFFYIIKYFSERRKLDFFSPWKPSFIVDVYLFLYINHPFLDGLLFRPDHEFGSCILLATYIVLNDYAQNRRQVLNISEIFFAYPVKKCYIQLSAREFCQPHR